MDRRRRIQDAELQKRMEDQQRAQEFAVHRDRAFQLERRHDPYDRQREDHFRIQEAERQRDLAAAYQRDVERARELDRQREIALQREHQREVEKRERELEIQREVERIRGIERQRDIDSQRDLELIQRRQQFHDPPLRFHDRPIPSPIITSPHPASISHLISHPPPRKSDPGQIKPLNSPIHTDPSLHHSDDTRQVKKRRYSDSPSRPLPNDKERMTREREKMVVGEIGYGRIDSPIAGPSSAPRRPGSGHGHGRKAMPVSELLLDKQAPISQSDHRDRLVSPLGRRSPPGSQIGRAKAARKSDEHIHKETLLPPPPLPPSLPIEPDLKKYKEEIKTREIIKVKEEIRPREEVKFKEEPKSREGTRLRDAKEDTKPTRHRLLQDDIQHKKSVTSAPIPAPPPPPSKAQLPSKTPQDDAHEWFLQQYEDLSPTTSSRPEPPHSPSPSQSPATSTLPVHGPRSPPASQKMLTPITAAVSLEQELEELVSEPPPPTSSTSANKKQDPDDTDMDLDVDLAVTELVAETLNGEDVKHEHEHLGMEVDVEDELLSLIDDRPVVNNSVNMVRRTSMSHATAIGAGTGAKQPPLLRSVGDAPHTSPTISASSSTTLVSPAAQHPSTRPTSERGSMPPPATTNTVAKKSNERAPAKKKKEPGPKVRFTFYYLVFVCLLGGRRLKLPLLVI
jgi:COMPASS component SPP1